MLRVLGFGTYDAKKHPRAEIILDGLRAHGAEVLEINEPLGFGTGERVDMLARPWLSYRLVLRILARWASLSRRALRIPGGRRFDGVFIGYLGQFDVLLARLLFPRGRIVLDLLIFAADTARDRRERGGLKLRLLEGLDYLSTRCADVVVLDTEEHISLLRSDVRDRAIVVPVGASADWFAAGAARRRTREGPLSVVFFGLYTPLQGATVIGEALSLLAGSTEIAVTMVGAGQEYAVTRRLAAANAEVRWIDWVEADRLPSFVAGHDVCLGVFGTTPKALRVVPNKVYQGAAAGCAIVTSDTAPQRRMLEGAARYVNPGDPEALASVLRELAADRPTAAALGSAAREVAVRRFTPAAVVAPLHARLAR